MKALFRGRAGLHDKPGGEVVASKVVVSFKVELAGKPELPLEE